MNKLNFHNVLNVVYITTQLSLFTFVIYVIANN